MRKSLYPLAVIALLLVGIAVTGTGCGGRKAGPTPAGATTPPPAVEPTPAPPAPTITLTASPAAIVKGQTATLSWRTSNATEVTIDGGIGTVEGSGSRTVSPSASTTYRARATGPGGVADAEVRLTVSAEEPGVIVPTERRVSDSELFTERVKDAFFDYDKYDIRDDAREALLQDVQLLKERSNIRITIEGHCDERGSEAYNLALGDKRANAARDFLIAQGISAARIDTISYGEEKPFAPGHDEEAWKQNRRAHLVMR
ncbi:MAG: peptidoglycan-associated lipoprotein Pal [Acidobacteriia bacterium]|nr:peptidoglycan-associated lipoprotein Pal [Terriglobia bacterium]